MCYVDFLLHFSFLTEHTHTTTCSFSLPFFRRPRQLLRVLVGVVVVARLLELSPTANAAGARPRAGTPQRRSCTNAR